MSEAPQQYHIQNGYYWDGYQWKPVPVDPAAPMSDTDQAAFNLAKPIGGIGGLLAGKELMAAGTSSAPTIANLGTSMGAIEAIPGFTAAAPGAGAGAGTTVATASGTVPAATGGLGAVGSVALPAAAAAGTAASLYNYGGKHVLEGSGNSKDYANLGAAALGGATINPMLDAVGLGSVGEVLGLGGIHPGHAKRDSLRDKLREIDFFSRQPGEGDYDFVKLANGNYWNTGNEKVRPDYDGTNAKHWYDLNWENPGDIKDEASQTNMVGRLNPLAAILAGGDDQLTGQLVGYLQNAATSNDQGQANLQNFYDMAGLDDRTNAINMVNDLKASGAIDDWEQVAYHNAINMQFGDDGSGSYDYSKLGGGPDASHQSYFDAYFGNKTPEEIKKEEEAKANSGPNYELV